MLFFSHQACGGSAGVKNTPDVAGKQAAWARASVRGPYSPYFHANHTLTLKQASRSSWQGLVRDIGYESTDIVENIVSSEKDVVLLGHFQLH